MSLTDFLDAPLSHLPNVHIQTQTPDLCVPCAQFDLELKSIHLLLDMRPCPIRLLAAQSKLVEVIFTISMLYNYNSV